MCGIILGIDIGMELWGIRHVFFSALAHTAKSSSIPKLLCQFTFPPTVHETSGCAAFSPSWYFRSLSF